MKPMMKATGAAAAPTGIAANMQPTGGRKGRPDMMHNMHGVRIEPKARQLMDTDRRIRETAKELSDKTYATAKMIASAKGGSFATEIRQQMGEMRVLAEFVRTLFDRRETILREMGKMGICEADVYRAMRAEAEEMEAAMRCTG